MLDNVGHTSAQPPSPEYHMNLPEPSKYLDIHSEHAVPTLPFGRIEDFFASCGKQFEEKYQPLYEQRYAIVNFCL